MFDHDNHSFPCLSPFLLSFFPNPNPNPSPSSFLPLLPLSSPSPSSSLSSLSPHPPPPLPSPPSLLILPLLFPLLLPPLSSSGNPSLYTPLLSELHYIKQLCDRLKEDEEDGDERTACDRSVAPVSSNSTSCPPPSPLSTWELSLSSLPLPFPQSCDPVFFWTDVVLAARHQSLSVLFTAASHSTGRGKCQ